MTNSGVYTIIHTRSKKLYIGSAINIKKRWILHLHYLRKNRHHSQHLQRSWNQHGEHAFEFKTILICEPFELLRYEQAFIDRWRPAYNCLPTAGSRLGTKLSPETRKKISRAKVGKPLSLEHRASIARAQQGKKLKPLSTEHRNKISKAKKGKKHGPMSLETRTKISVAKKGKKRVPFSLEARAHMSAAHMGKKRYPAS